MENQTNKVRDIDERPYGREGIEKMLDRLNSNDDDGNSQSKQSHEGIA